MKNLVLLEHNPTFHTLFYSLMFTSSHLVIQWAHVVVCLYVDHTLFLCSVVTSAVIRWCLREEIRQDQIPFQYSRILNILVPSSYMATQPRAQLHESKLSLLQLHSQPFGTGEGPHKTLRSGLKEEVLRDWEESWSMRFETCWKLTPSSLYDTGNWWEIFEQGIWIFI